MTVQRLGMFVFIVVVNAVALAAADEASVTVTITRAASGEVDAAEIIAALGGATRTAVAKPASSLSLKLDGVSGTLTRRLLTTNLGTDIGVSVSARALTLTIPQSRLEPGRRGDWEQRLRDLALAVDEAGRRRTLYGMRALKSYVPNDPARPTVCLIHGVNSSSGGFVHMIPPVEEAGYGIVVYDYPYNRSLEESGAAFERDWKAFRREAGERRPWAIVAHSMGALVARSYVEDPQEFDHDVSHLILIAPVNQGSNLAQAQTLLQLLKGVRASNGKTPADGLSHLADGLGEAAEDMKPRSAYLKALNRRPRAQDVSYHILAGDIGVLTTTMRKQIEDQTETLRRDRGLLGGLTRAATSDLAERLDELTTGTGDGCVSVANTKLAGVTDHVTIHANHAELIRAPLLFADPGPVACMPDLLRWLAQGNRTRPQASKSR